MTENEVRYLLAQDNDCHWYVIPEENIEDWNEFTALHPDDERSWDVPEFAREVGGSPSLVIFTNPEIK